MTTATGTATGWEEAFDEAVAARASLLDARHEHAVRLFNGFTEGHKALAVDLLGHTLVVFDHAPEPADDATARAAAAVARARFPFVRAAVWKARHAADPAMRTGTLLFGEARDVDRSVRENGVRYAILPTVNHDASFYVDTRALRAWAKDALKDKRVLNAFAYTGSLGVAACAGGAKQVVHLDKSRAFLSVAKDSYTLNGFPIRRSDFVAADFFEQVARYKRADELFDCVFVDPPFFAAGGRGRIDLEAGAARVFNKVRPLVGDGGALVAVNNALFVSGKEYLGVLEAMCKDGYLTIESLVPVPDDARGMVPRGTPAWPSDPAPFGHPTKIAVLRVRRKDGRRA